MAAIVPLTSVTAPALADWPFTSSVPPLTVSALLELSALPDPRTTVPAEIVVAPL